jgi:hypothetical protein
VEVKKRFVSLGGLILCVSHGFYYGLVESTSPPCRFLSLQNTYGMVVRPVTYNPSFRTFRLLELTTLI